MLFNVDKTSHALNLTPCPKQKSEDYRQLTPEMARSCHKHDLVACTQSLSI